MGDEERTAEEVIRAQLEATMGPVFYAYLQAHLARNAVFVVAPGVPLVMCGVAIARGDVERVSAWIAAGEVRRPSLSEHASWAIEAGRQWTAIVVQPYVLIQDTVAPA